MMTPPPTPDHSSDCRPEQSFERGQPQYGKQRMTLIAAIALPTGELAFVGDSISTTTSQAAFNIGRTTHGEALQPIIIREQAIGFTEGACKVGAFGNTICAAAGNAVLIYDVLRKLEASIPLWTDLPGIDKSLSFLQAELFGSSLCGTEAILNFGFRTPAGIMFCTLALRVLPDQSLRVQRQCKLVEPGEWWVGYFGSGAELMGQYYPGCVGAYQDDPSLRNLLPSMLAMDLSARVRTAQFNQAAGVGGTFVSVILGQNDLIRSTDVFHIHADASGVIQFFCKVLFRRGIYLVNDVIGRRGFGMRSLEEEVAYLQGRYPGNQDITPEVTELLQFQARAILLDVRSTTAPNTPDVRIVENHAGTALTFLGVADLPLGAYPEPGSPMQIRTASESLDLRVRRA